MKKALTLLFATTISSTVLMASHMMGGDLTYKCIGGSDYEVTLSFYRDCSGISAPQVANVRASSASCALDSLYSFQLDTTFEVNPGCSNWLTTCNGGSVPGVEMYIYRDTVALGATCDDWLFSFELCCRNAAISNLVNASTQSDYFQATLDNLNFPCNSSPVFQEQPQYIVCLNQPFCVNNTAYEPDGDSLIYEMVDPLSTAGVPIPFIAPYSAINPMPSSSGINFDVSTGNMCITPSALGSYVVNFKVSEYRNGMLVGTTMRDMQIWVASCPASMYNIAGTVRDTDSVAVNSGTVDVFEYNLNMGSMNLFGTQPLGAGGTYSFTNVPYGQYMVRATPDNINYPNTAATYHLNTFFWNYGNVLSAFCDSSFVADVQLVGYGNLAGTGFMGGYLGELGVRSTIGDPFMNIGIYVLRTNDEKLVASTMTDLNGNWSVSGLPFGDYKVYVDVPGLSMLSWHYVTIGPGSDSHGDLDYLAEPAGIMVAPISSDLGSPHIDDLVSIFPNPASDILNLEIDTRISGDAMQIELLDMAGRRLQQWDLNVEINNKLKLPLLSNGRYLIKISSELGTTTKHLNILR